MPASAWVCLFSFIYSFIFSVSIYRMHLLRTKQHHVSKRMSKTQPLI